MRPPVLIPVINQRPGQFLAKAKLHVGLGEKHDPAIRGDAPAVKRGCDFLAANGRKPKAKLCSLVHGGCGGSDLTPLPGSGAAIEAMRFGIAMRLFQASKHASTMSS